VKNIADWLSRNKRTGCHAEERFHAERSEASRRPPCETLSAAKGDKDLATSVDSSWAPGAILPWGYWHERSCFAFQPIVQENSVEHNGSYYHRARAEKAKAKSKECDEYRKNKERQVNKETTDQQDDANGCLASYQPANPIDTKKYREQ
jgi:hypothetical protein